MNRQERHELLRQLDRRTADPINALAAAAIRDLQEKLDNANEASMSEYHRHRLLDGTVTGPNEDY